MKKLNALSGKSKAMSLQSIIIGSIIASILASVGMAVMWPAIDRAKITKEKQELETAALSIGSYRDTNGPIMNLFDKFNGRSNLMEEVNLFMNGDDGVVRSFRSYSLNGKSSLYYTKYFDYENLSAVNDLRLIATPLNDYFDKNNFGPIVLDGDVKGNFVFDTTCSNQNNCGYMMRIDVANSLSDSIKDQIVFSSIGDFRTLTNTISESSGMLIHQEFITGHLTNNDPITLP